MVAVSVEVLCAPPSPTFSERIRRLMRELRRTPLALRSVMHRTRGIHPLKAALR